MKPKTQALFGVDLSLHMQIPPCHSNLSRARTYGYKVFHKTRAQVWISASLHGDFKYGRCAWIYPYSARKGTVLMLHTQNQQTMGQILCFVEYKSGEAGDGKGPLGELVTAP